MCYNLFNRKNLNALERNSKKYVKGKFQFLTENGYKLKYFSQNAEELFDFNKEDIHIYISKDGEHVDCSFSDGDNSERNIRTIAGDSFDKQFDMLTDIEKMNYLASLVETHLNTIEGNKYNNSKEKVQYLAHQKEKLKCIEQVLDEVDPMGLLAMGCPKDEYEQEALMLAKVIVGCRITWKQVEDVFESQFDQKLPEKISKLIAYKIAVGLVELDDFFREFYSNDLLRDKVSLQNGSIVLKVHDNFVVESACGKTYINGKFYFDIEDQDLEDCFCDFVADDTKVYIQYAHKHFGLHYEQPFRYFKVTSHRFSLEKLSHRNDIELVFDNKQVLYSAENHMKYLTERQIVELMRKEPIDGKYENALFSADSRKRILIYKKDGYYTYDYQRLTILDDYERECTRRYAIWEPDWEKCGVSVYDTLEHLLDDIAPNVAERK